ncbi:MULTISPECIES: glycosyltransferase [unclassified Nocardioides]|uniref:glycosyltransferase n=1 Tax=unclassified Nocardioides TaxID=2615069 RepID=UPI00361862B0
MTIVARPAPSHQFSKAGVDLLRATLVVVTWNSRDHLPALAASLPAALEGMERVRLVVVDNSSGDGTPEAAEELWPHAVVHRSASNGGYAAGINLGAALADPGEIVIAMNPDLRLRPGCIRELCATFADDEVGLAFPRLLDPDGHTTPSIRREPSVGRVWAEGVLGGNRAARLGRGEMVTGPDRYAEPSDVDWATGAMVAVAPRCRSTIGAWDESFFLYSEEVDYCRRARVAGFRVRYEPGAVVEHASGPYGSNVELWRTLVGNRAIDFGRHHGRASRVLFRSGLAVGQALRAPRSAAHRAGVRAALTARDRRRTGPGMIWFAAQDWWYHNQAHSDFQLMREVAVTSPVLVVNSLGLRLPRKGVSVNPARRILRKLRSTLKLVRRPVPGLPGFHVMTPLILPFYGDTAGARLSAWLIRQQVRVVARLIGIRGPADVGVTIPTAWPVVAGLPRTSLVFNRSDLQSAFPEADGGWVRSLEEELLRNSDRVLYVSHELMRLDHDLVGDRGFFLDHGADVEHFTPDGPVDDEIDRIPGPRVGFFGGLDDYVVDMDLLRRTAADLPDVQLVLVGDATCPMDDLTALPNVHWLGYRPYASIPALGRGFDVALMPWLDNEWIRFANPIKLKEYLALGLPVVTTDYPEVEDYRDRVRVATDADEFVALVRAALEDPGDPAALRESVLGATWQARAHDLVELVRDVREQPCAE